MNWKLYGRKQSLHVSRYYLAFGRRDWKELQKTSIRRVGIPVKIWNWKWLTFKLRTQCREATNVTTSANLLSHRYNISGFAEMWQASPAPTLSVSVSCQWVTCKIFLRNVNDSTNLSLHCSCSSAAASSFIEATSHSSKSSCITNIASAHCQDITSHMAWGANVQHVSKLFGHF